MGMNMLTPKLNVTRELLKKLLPEHLSGNRELYLRASAISTSNQGADDQGNHRRDRGRHVTKIDRLILRYERFRSKPNGGPCPLGIPTWTDKMLQEVIRMILEAFFWLERHSGDHLELNTWYQRYL